MCGQTDVQSYPSNQKTKQVKRRKLGAVKRTTARNSSGKSRGTKRNLATA